MDPTVIFSGKGTVHAQVEVLQRGTVRYLRFGPQGGWQGALDLAADDIVFPYQRAFASLVGSRPPVSRYLSLGVGTGTSLRSVRKAHPAAEMYGVELDQSVVDLAIHYFNSPQHTDVNYWIGDGVDFLCRVDLQFDLIFVDAYMRDHVYDPCLQPDFAAVLHAALVEDGVAATNLIARWPFRGAVRDFLDAAEQLFEAVWLLPVGVPLTDQNMLVVLSKSTATGSAWRQEMAGGAALNISERVLWPLRLRRYSAASVI